MIQRAFCLILTAAALGLPPGGPQSTSAPATLTNRLDALAASARDQHRLAGLSVAVVHRGRTLLDRGYGFAEIGLQVPSTSTTTYRLLGPALAAALMQQVERGRLRLDDKASDLLPEFPWQGRTVTIRQLMDATSGLPDYHYLGDAHIMTIPVPKAPDEVTALVAGRPFVHEPGAAWTWTITGFHLAGTLIERLTGQPYPDYLRTHVFSPAGLTRTHYCDERSVTPGLARGYTAPPSGFLLGPPQSATMYPYVGTVCTTAGDAASLLRALRDGRLLKAESWRAMTTAEGAAARAGAHGARGVGVRMNQEEEHRWWGEAGSLLSFGSAVIDFPAEDLTIAVLTNTSSPAPLVIARNLAREVLGLPLLPYPPRAQPAELAERAPLSTTERAAYIGTYRTRWIDPPPHYVNFERTYRVFEHRGRLMIQATGEEPEPLLRQEGHTFAMRGRRVTFTLDGSRAVAIELAAQGSVYRGPIVTGR